nr:RNA-directed DNA polymerase, eukaryota, reverse transcriptase zinc-binding domain protein [Tanacetum cinerariifolium]
MESLHLSFQRVVDAGLFTGIKLNQSVTLSHMFYADDAIFVGQWSDSNITTLVHVLDCFFRASCLRINMKKSKILRVNVNGDNVKQAANKLGCLILKCPFLYFGTKVGGSMNRVDAWNEVVDKVGSKKAIWVKWNDVLKDKARGGLGVASLYALNRGLLVKWYWKFFNQNSSLWAKVIKAIYGEDGGVDSMKIGNGDTVSFWKDDWQGEGALKILFPRLFALENSKDVTVNEKLRDSSLLFSFRRNTRGTESAQYNGLVDLVSTININPSEDRWNWSLESSREFTVAYIRRVIDEKGILSVHSQTRWVKFVPIKLNVLAWKIKLDAIPTRLNISRRGIDIPCLECPCCGRGVESSAHIFFQCNLVRQIARRLRVGGTLSTRIAILMMNGSFGWCRYILGSRRS